MVGYVVGGDGGLCYVYILCATDRAGTIEAKFSACQWGRIDQKEKVSVRRSASHGSANSTAQEGEQL